jgi:asparagine synthase (glutamine-hydrolysing)
MSEVPLGAFLSGGIDSSAVVAAMAGAPGAGARGGPGVDAICVGIPAGGLDERPFARTVASELGVRLHEELAEADVAELLPRLVAHLDAPFADTSAAPTWLLCAAARRHVTVALSGDGGDENFAGYRRTRYDVLEQRWRARLPAGLRRGVLGPLGRAWPAGPGVPRPLRAGTLLGNLAEDWLGAYVTSMARVRESTARELLRPGLVDARAAARRLRARGLALRGSRPAAPRAGDGLRHLAARRHPGQGRPHVDGARPRGARAAARHGLRDLGRGPAGRGAARARAGQGPAAARAGDPRARRRARAAQAGLPPAGGPVAARRAASAARRGARRRRGPAFEWLVPERCAALAAEHAAGRADRSTELWFLLVLDTFLRQPAA